MNHPLQITFRHMEPSPAVEARIQEEAAKLERYFEPVVSCRVVIEAPHRHHRHGGGYDINIHIGVPNSEIIVRHDPSLHSTLVQGEAGEWTKQLEAQPDHKDIYVSIRDAFSAARRQLEDYARRLRGEVKHHAAPEPSPEAGPGEE